MDESETDHHLAEAARGFHAVLPDLATAMAEFGGTHQIEITDVCVVAVKRPTPTRQDVTVAPTVPALLAKLRAERDGSG